MITSKRLKGSVLILLTLLLFSVMVIAPVFAVTVEFWDSCETLGNWTFLNGASGAINTTIQQEGTGCLNVSHSATYEVPFATRDFISTQRYVGFWAMRGTGVYSSFKVYATGGGGTYYVLFWYHSVENNVFISKRDDMGMSGVDSTITWTANTWYWFECYQNNAGDFVFRINGGTIWTYGGSGTLFGNYSQFMIYTQPFGAAGVSSVDFIRVSDGFQYPPSEAPSIYFDVSADLENIDDGTDWVFTDWKYYNFTVTTNKTDLESNPIENVSFYFNVPTGEEEIPVVFFTDGYDWTYSSNMTYESREGEPCILKAGSWSDNGTHIFATFHIWFESRILDVWADSDALDVWGSYNSIDWFIAESNLFRIYSKGGFEMNFAATGAAGKLPGGTPFSLYGNNGSIVYNEIWYRDGQHIKLMPDIHFLAGLDPFYVRYGVDYSVGDGEWLEGWSIYINPKSVAYTGWFAGNVWINMSNLWMNRGIYVDSKDLYMFYHGSVSGVGDPGHWKSWVDLWFSDKNASRVGAGRYNAYEYPMMDSADLWLRWMANNWGVKDDVFKEMSLAAPLYDIDNSTVISSEQIKMVRFWCELEVDDADGGQYVSIENYEAFDITHSRDLPLVGMSDPVFDETLIPTVGQKGILGALWSLFAGMGQWLGDNVLFGGLNLWSTFVNFLDTIAGMLGAPDFFTNLFTWIGESVGYLGVTFDYLIEIVVDVFSLFGSLLGAFLETMGDLITSMVNTVTIFTDMMEGAYGSGVDIWETLGISSWLTVAIIFYPLYLVILWDQEGMDAVLKQLTWIFGLLSWVFTFMSGVISEGISLISTLIESIPVAE